MPRKRSKVSLMDLINAQLIRPGQLLQFHQRRDIQAQVTPRGTVLFQGLEYKTLSEAGRVATGHETNGWDRWYLKSDGDSLTKIAEIRRELEK
jgi:hypothetical protein